MQKYIVSLLLIASSSSLFALDAEDDRAIHQIVEHFTTVWNDHDGHGSGICYAQDADFVNIFGAAFSGREEIEERHIQILETFLKGSRFEVMDLRLREAKPDVVIAHVYWKVSHIQQSGKLNETIKGIFTHVFVKNQDRWEITATQNTLISN
jgi:uncharacterized protein (TIGR02246 family)